MRSDDISLIMSESIPAAIVLTGIDGQRIYANPFLSVVTGFNEEELLELEGDILQLLTVEDDRERLERARRMAMLSEEMSVIHRIRHRSGLTLWVETQFIPVVGPVGGGDDDSFENDVSAVMSVSTDVTRLKNYERLIEEQNRDLQDFTYMVSHDLKAPVFTIKGMAEALKEDCKELGETGSSYLSHIVSASVRLERLIGSILEYSSLSIKPPTLSAVRLADTFSQVLADLGKMILDTDAMVKIPSELPTIEGDGIRLYQLFSNLIGNALKYRSPERAPEVHITVETNDDQVVILVSDNGVGIPTELLKDVFRPYQRAHKGRVEGSGIGLACVNKIVSRMNGDVSVSSVVGAGSEFRISWPKAVLR